MWGARRGRVAGGGAYDEERDRVSTLSLKSIAHAYVNHVY